MDTRGKDRWKWKWDTRVFLAIAVVLFLVGKFVFFSDVQRQSIGYGKFKQLLAEAESTHLKFRQVKVGTAEIRGEMESTSSFTATEKPLVVELFAKAQLPMEPGQVIPFRVTRIGVEQDQDLYAILQKHAADYTADEEPVLGYFWFGLVMVGTILLFIYFMRWMLGTSSSPFGFGKSKHKVYGQKESGRVTFANVAGIDEAKAELLEVVDFLKNPNKYTALGGRIPKGVLLVGPPGTGKTLLARSVAGEAGVPFFSMSGSDFVEMFVGVGASRVRDLFRDAEQNAPCIIFIDELDALGKSRSGNMVHSHEEREQTLNQLLVEMDGFDPNRGVIIMGATNRPEILDAALLRPGRFDRTIVVDRPDVHGREAILQVHAQTVKIAEDVDLRRVAALTPGSVGADLANLVNEAALLAARKGRDSVTMADFDEAIERGAVGLERRSRIMRPEEKRHVAVHEAGHALVAFVVPGSDPVHKVSIIPRGLAGGYVLQRPEADRMLLTRRELEARIKVSLGGTLAEELLLSDISTGASSDLQKANDIATRMVKEFGMSDLGRIFHSGGDSTFLPMYGDTPSNYSEQTAREIDIEVRKIVERCLADVRSVLSSSRDALEAISQRLMDREVIDGQELQALLQTFGVSRNDPDSIPKDPKPHSELNGKHELLI